MVGQSDSSSLPRIVDGQLGGTAGQLVSAAFGQVQPVVLAVNDVNQGRGVFSDVWRIELQWPEHASAHNPKSVVAKVPTAGANGVAAKKSGAYDREHLAYTELLPTSAVRRPELLATIRTDETWSFLLEDLSEHRAVNQIDGMAKSDALTVGGELAILHREWEERDGRKFGIRGPTVQQLDPTALERGITVLKDRWANYLDDDLIATFVGLLANRQALVEAFASQTTPTLCHGDPRADNLVFDDHGTAILFDWQQTAFQLGEADLAWLAATSLKPSVRADIDEELIRSYGGSLDRYRLGFVLPGLAVLLLAQRDAPDERTQAFIAESLVRIATALSDFEVASYL